jgi:hypothetical protein
MPPAKTDETAQPSSSSSSSSSKREIEDDDEDEDDHDVSFLFPVRPEAGGPTEHRTLRLHKPEVWQADLSILITPPIRNLAFHLEVDRSRTVSQCAS